MAGVVSEKLYPPIIGSTIPAFYEENGTVKITVPFSMNRAVSAGSVAGFKLKIKTVQSNTFLYTCTIGPADVANTISQRTAVFTWDDVASRDKVKLGQYLKVQIAYIGANGVVGYFSTVGITKRTSKPNVYIDGINRYQVGQIETFKHSYIGVYETTDDKSERPYSYCFFMYNSNHELIDTSGWQLHNTSINNIASESLSLDRATDVYSFNVVPQLNEEYFIQYAVRSINGLEIYSPLYTCIDPETQQSDAPFNLVAENNFEEGYIAIGLSAAASFTAEELTESQSISIEISRAEKTDNYASWILIKRAYFSSYQEMINWHFEDLAIEQGITYKYSFRQYNAEGVLSNRSESNLVNADFEDMFLWSRTNGKVRQLKIRFNPKVASFKTTQLAQKIDTIGSKYPFIFRNGVVSYKEFPISGLISYLADNNEMFINHEEDLHIIMNDTSEREGTPSAQTSYETVATLNSIGYNMRAERRFKLLLLDWLNNGEIKFFKSPAEGNYLVRLLNVSLSPEDKVGRMIHTFNCTAYEVEEINYNNLLDLGFITVDEPIETTIREKSILIREILSDYSTNLTQVKLNDYNIYGLLRIEPASGTNTGTELFKLRIGNDPNNQVQITGIGLNLESPNTDIPDIYFNYSDNGITTLEEAISLVGDTMITYQYIYSSVQAGEFLNLKSVTIQNKVETILGPRYNDNYVDFGVNTYQVANNGDIDYYSVETLRLFVLDFQKKGNTTLYCKDNKYYEVRNPDANSQIIPSRLFDTHQIYSIYFLDNNNNITDYRKYYYNGASLQQLLIDTRELTRDFNYFQSEDTQVNSNKQYYSYDNNTYSLIASPSGNPRNNGYYERNYHIYTVKLINGDNVSEFEIGDTPLNLNGMYYQRIEMGAGILLNCAYQTKTTVRTSQE